MLKTVKKEIKHHVVTKFNITGIVKN